MVSPLHWVKVGRAGREAAQIRSCAPAAMERRTWNGD